MSDWDVSGSDNRQPPQPPPGPPSYGGGSGSPPPPSEPPKWGAGVESPPGTYQPPSYPQPPSRGPSRSSVALSALIVGLISLVVPVLGGVVAVILAIIGLVQISRSNGAQTGNGLAVAGLILGLLTTGGYMALFTSDSFQEGLEEGLQEGLDDGLTGQQGDTLGIEPGQCLDVEVADTSDFQMDESDVVSCDEPHGAEFAGRVTLPNPTGDPYPGEDEVFLAGLDLCLDTFVDYVGVELGERPELDILVVYPQEINWRATNDRNVECLIVNADASPLEGPVSRTTSSR